MIINLFIINLLISAVTVTAYRILANKAIKKVILGRNFKVENVRWLREHTEKYSNEDFEWVKVAVTRGKSIIPSRLIVISLIPVINIFLVLVCFIFYNELKIRLVEFIEVFLSECEKERGKF